MAQLFIISGSSGSGKTTLLYALLQEMPTLQRAITYTSRAQRPGEQDGYDYHFISQSEFQDRIENGFFLEWSMVYDHYYGSSITIIESLYIGEDQIVILDYKGACALKQAVPGAVLIWIEAPEDIQLLQQRLQARGGEVESENKMRIKDLWFGMQQIDIYSAYQYRIAHNSLAQMLHELKIIVKLYISSSNRVIEE